MNTARDNLALFLKWFRTYGANDAVLFESDDVIYLRNPLNVLCCLMAVRRLTDRKLASIKAKRYPGDARRELEALEAAERARKEAEFVARELARKEDAERRRREEEELAAAEKRRRQEEARLQQEEEERRRREEEERRREEEERRREEEERRRQEEEERLARERAEMEAHRLQEEEEQRRRDEEEARQREEDRRRREEEEARLRQLQLDQERADSEFKRKLAEQLQFSLSVKTIQNQLRETPKVHPLLI